MPKLLLVEDDNNLREIYQARLQAEGYTIVTAKDGEEALVVAKAEKPDLVVSDVMMPKISGFEMLDILRNTDGLKEVKVIMLTALGQSDDQARADKLGADRYLVKSQVTLEDIVKTAHELLQESGAESAPADSAPAEAPAPVPAPAEPAPIAVASAPVAVAPAPEPTPAPVVEAPVAVAPAPAPEPAPAPAVTEAQTTASEEASVDANIETFVAGASSEAPAPAPAVDQAAVESDDKIMSDAADSLAEAAKPAEEAPAPAPITVPVTETPAPEAPVEAEKPAAVGGVRVIEPTDSEPKKDINDLLALEEAKEAATSGAPAPQQPLQAPASPTPSDGTDPSSIAL